jgi:ribosomal small subunit protein bTHX
MGKGDIKTRKGKLNNRTFGVQRRRKRADQATAAKAAAKK